MRLKAPNSSFSIISDLRAKCIHVSMLFIHLEGEQRNRFGKLDVLTDESHCGVVCLRAFEDQWLHDGGLMKLWKRSDRLRICASRMR